MSYRAHRLLSAAVITISYGCLSPPVAAAPQRSEPVPAEVRAASAGDFLSSIGVNTHVDQGYDAGSYIEPLRYTGIREVRDGSRNITRDVMLHRLTGVRFDLLGGGDLKGLTSSAKTLADAGALLALEGPNEPNNFPISYKGSRGGGLTTSWMPVAQFQQDLYAWVKSDPTLKRYPVFGPSEVGAETDNVGLQFLRIPVGAGASLPDGTRFADYLNVHNYVSGNGHQYSANQAWNAADPTLRDRWDGLVQNNGATWRRHFRGYSDSQLQSVPKVTTETGWDSVGNPGGQHTQGTILTNVYLAQFKRGWRYTFVYEMRDGEGGGGNQGLYHGSMPKLAAMYIHNLTTILSDRDALPEPSSLKYVVSHAPNTVHDLLLQKSTGQFELVIWDERVSGEDNVSVDLGEVHRNLNVYDVTAGTTPVQTLANVKSVPLVLSDHAVILEISR